VIAAHDTVSLEQLFVELDARRQKKALAWDPHHVDSDLRPAIRAGFALGPADAASRFARWFEAVDGDAAAKVAHDIWMLGLGVAVHHDGTHLATGDGDMLDGDPGWMVVAARFAHHPRLGPTARGLLKRVDPKRRAALVAEHAHPAPPKAAKAP